MTSYRLIPTDDTIAGDAPTQSRIDGYIAAINTAIAPFQYQATVATTSFDLKQTTFSEFGLGDLVADSYLAIVTSVQGPIDLAVEASGTIRSDVLKGTTGKIWFADAFRVLPLGIGPDAHPGYPLVSFYLNGKDLKGGMEVSAAALDVFKSNDFFLQISSGAVMTYAPASAPFNRVRSLHLPRAM